MLNREPRVDILRPGLIVSAIVAVGQAFEALLLRCVDQNLFGAEFICETFPFGIV